jgi:hypothetical protein
MAPTSMNQNTTAQYKPKTGIINRDEIIGDNEMFFLTVLTDEFEPRIMPSQELLMRRGCLAEDGDIVAPGNQPDEKKAGHCTGFFMPEIWQVLPTRNG